VPQAPTGPNTTYPNYRGNRLLVGAVDAISGRPLQPGALGAWDEVNGAWVSDFGASRTDSRTIKAAKPSKSAAKSAAASLRKLEALPADFERFKPENTQCGQNERNKLRSLFSGNAPGMLARVAFASLNHFTGHMLMGVMKGLFEKIAILQMCTTSINCGAGYLNAVGDQGTHTYDMMELEAPPYPPPHRHLPAPHAPSPIASSRSSATS
jgi:hypothetical protein